MVHDALQCSARVTQGGGGVSPTLTVLVLPFFFCFFWTIFTVTSMPSFQLISQPTWLLGLGLELGLGSGVRVRVSRVPVDLAAHRTLEALVLVVGVHQVGLREHLVREVGVLGKDEGELEALLAAAQLG